MDRFVAAENIVRFYRMLEAETDVERRRVARRLLGEELAKSTKTDRPQTEGAPLALRFFFDLGDKGAFRDDVGLEFGDLEAAIVHARVFAQFMRTHNAASSEFVIVTDEGGRVVHKEPI